MNRNWSCAVLATAAGVLATAGALSAQVRAMPITNAPGAINTVPGVQRNTSSTKFALPSIRMGGWGVRSEAPRANVNGTLLPAPAAPSTPQQNPATLPDNFFHASPHGATGGVHDGRFFPPAFNNNDHVSIGTSGFDAAVTASGDHWRFAAALNNSIDYSWLNHRHRGDGWHQHLPGWGWNFGYLYGWPYSYGGYGYGYYPSTFGYGDGYYAPTDSFIAYGGQPQPAQPAVDPDAGLTDPQKAVRRLHDGKPDEAIVLLRPYADAHQEDPAAARLLAVALLDARRTKEGVAVMALLYEHNPALANTPVAGDVVGPERELRDLVVRVVEYGHRTNTASAWLTAAVLMQGEGRAEPALRMIERADTLGLDTEVSKAMHAALKP
jgi:hypothetical protein